MLAVALRELLPSDWRLLLWTDDERQGPFSAQAGATSGQGEEGGGGGRGRNRLKQGD